MKWYRELTLIGKVRARSLFVFLIPALLGTMDMGRWMGPDLPCVVLPGERGLGLREMRRGEEGEINSCPRPAAAQGRFRGEAVCEPGLQSRWGVHRDVMRSR